MINQTSKARQQQHDKIESDVEAYLNKGGQIRQCTSEDNASWQREKWSSTKARQRSFSLRHEQ